MKSPRRKACRRAELKLVGEQPGDREDLEGEPFVGPAGRLVDRALNEAEIAAVTIHPSAILRSREDAEREEGLSALVEDLRSFAASVHEG